MRCIRIPIALCAGVASLALLTANAAAAETGQWLVRAGASNIDPTSDNGKLKLSRAVPGLPSTDIEVDDQTGFTFNVSYFLSPNLAVELLAAYPYEHDFTLTDVNIDGHVKHLPPTLSLQYHFPLNSRFEPYVGVGVNYTMFSDAKVQAPVNVSLDDSFGPAVQAGIDIALTDHWLLNFDVRYIQIEPEAKVNGRKVGTVDIDPTVYGINIGYRF